MCTICRKFKKGSLSVAEAREELEDQIEYLSEEKKVLVNQRDFQRHKNGLQEIRDGVERLEKRIALLQKSQDRV